MLKKLRTNKFMDKNITTTHKKRSNDNKNNEDNNNNSKILDKTLFINGCDCGVVVDPTSKLEDTEVSDNHHYLQLTYKTKKPYTNNNNNNNNCRFEQIKEDGNEEGISYKEDCFVETSDSESNNNNPHVYACLEKAIDDEYSTNDSGSFEDHIYEIVN